MLGELQVLHLVSVKRFVTIGLMCTHSWVHFLGHFQLFFRHVKLDAMAIIGLNGSFN